MSSDRLSEQQMAFFDTFGYLAFPGLLVDRIDEIIYAFETVWAAHGGGHHGKEHDGKARSMISAFADQSEYLSSLLDDPRIHGIAASICGDDFNYTGSDGNYYVGDSIWHSDGYVEKKYLTFKIAFYLDPVTRDTGCLRVIPGSHRYGDKFADAVEAQFHDRWADAGGSLDPQLSLGIHGSEVPAVALESEPGDVLVFNHVLKHASFGGSNRRRMFTFNFQERLGEEDLPEMREELAQTAAMTWSESAYGDAIVRTAGPARMRHLEQRMANDGQMAAAAREARQEMSEPFLGGPQYETEEWLTEWVAR